MSNTVIGAVLLASGLLAGVLAFLEPSAMLLVLSVFGSLEVFRGIRLPEGE